MKRILLINILIVLLLSAFVINSWAVFDDLEPSARARALSGAYAAITSNNDAMFYNPAGLARTNNYGLTISYYRPYGAEFFNTTTAGLSLPLGKYGTMGLSMTNFGVKYDGTDLSKEATYSLGHGIKLMEDIHSSLSFGYSMQLYSLSYPTESVSGIDLGSAMTYGFDIGAQATLRKRTYIAIYAHNLNSPQIGKNYLHNLPRKVTFAIAYEPYSGVISTCDIEKELGKEHIQMHAGLEFKIIDYLALRFGTKSNPNTFSGGLGINYNGINVDYAYSTHSVLGGTHHFGLSYFLSRE